MIVAPVTGCCPPCTVPVMISPAAGCSDAGATRPAPQPDSSTDNPDARTTTPTSMILHADGWPVTGLDNDRTRNSNQPSRGKLDASANCHIHISAMTLRRFVRAETSDFLPHFWARLSPDLTYRKSHTGLTT